MQLHEVFKEFRPVAQRIKDAGGNLYIVGGAVRDYLMVKNEPHDIDFCVTGIDAYTFQKLFPTARPQGKAFPVFSLGGCEFAMARIERKSGHGYTGFEVMSCPSVTITEDLERRDLTINSIAIDMLTGKLIDPYNGLDALEIKRIIHTSEAFKEDPVRVLRTARFASQYPDFYVAVETWDMLRELKPEMKYITPEQKFTELKKALCSKAPDRYFTVLLKSNTLEDIYPEVNALRRIPQNHHTDGDAYMHTMRTLIECRKHTDDPVLLYAALSHDFGKATTPEDVLPSHKEHEKRSVQIIDGIDWIPNEWKKYAKFFAENHMKGHKIHEMRKGTMVDLLEAIQNSSRGIKGFSILLFADRPAPDTMQNIIRLNYAYERAYSISGDDMPENTPQGPEFAKFLRDKRCGLIG
jgi:tRNA nucleotidyltransferase (CCA-adding enzyme)